MEVQSKSIHRKLGLDMCDFNGCLGQFRYQDVLQGYHAIITNSTHGVLGIGFFHVGLSEMAPRNCRDVLMCSKPWDPLDE